MHKTRIIQCLDVKDGRVVKGVNFVNLRDAGDPVEIATAYEKEGADELTFLKALIRFSPGVHFISPIFRLFWKIVFAICVNCTICVPFGCIPKINEIFFH